MPIVQIVSFCIVKNEFPLHIVVLHDGKNVHKACFCREALSRPDISRLNSFSLIRLNRYDIIPPDDIVYIYDFDFIDALNKPLTIKERNEFNLSQGYQVIGKRFS